MPNFFVNTAHKTISGGLDVQTWDIKHIKLVDDYGEPIIDPDEPTGFDFVPEEWHDEMSLVQTAKYYGLTPVFLDEGIGFDQYTRMAMYVKAFNYNHPSKKGQIRPGR